MSSKTIENVEYDRLRLFFSQAPGFMCLLHGPHHIFELANDAYYQLVGHRQILGKKLKEALPEVVAQGYIDKLNRVFETGEPFIGRALPLQVQATVGAPLEQHYIDLIYQPIRDASGQIKGIFVQGHDVSEAHRLALEVSYQAAHDSLTGLYNRREFTKRSLALEEVPGPHALLYMDLDHFKIVNDRGGHAAGDALLQKVAKVLQQEARKTDLLTRLGGDEFALILLDSSKEEALEVANRLRQKIRDIPFIWNDRHYSVTLSIGLVEFGTKNSRAFSEALSLADLACFLAKEKGRNFVQFSHVKDSEITGRHHDMDWVSRIKDCIQEDRIVLYGQSITALNKQGEDAFECLEVLSRMKDTQGNLIQPGSFIPAAERFGLIGDLDRHIIRKAFSKLHSLSINQYAQTRYFINVSGVTLGAPDFSEYIKELLDAYPCVCPRNVCFEVTETAAISSLEHTAELMRNLIAQGFSFALDDFGSGMSSFSYLQKLPVQYLKIDGEFVKGILDQPAGASIVEAVVTVARAMNILTIAESVEIPALLPLLREIGVDYGQGFTIHTPVPL